MRFAWVSPTNVTKVARALLQLNHTHLREQYYLDAAYFANQLRQALEQYQLPPCGEANIKTWGTIESIEAALMGLMAEIKLFVGLLTPKTQQQLTQQFQFTTVGGKVRAKK